MRRDLDVVVPVYNEERALPALLEKWPAGLTHLGVDFALHFYDDGSCDGSRRLLDAAARSDPRICVHGHANRGHGPTLARAYGERGEADWTLQIDADDTIGPEAFGTLWAEREGADLLLVARLDPGRPAMRRLLSCLARVAVRVLFGAVVRDANAPYRLMRNAAFRELFARLGPHERLPNVLLCGLAARRGLRVHEQRVTTAGRRRRESLVSGYRWLRLSVLGLSQLASHAVLPTTD